MRRSVSTWSESQQRSKSGCARGARSSTTAMALIPDYLTLSVSPTTPSSRWWASSAQSARSRCSTRCWARRAPTSCWQRSPSGRPRPARSGPASVSHHRWGSSGCRAQKQCAPPRSRRRPSRATCQPRITGRSWASSSTCGGRWGCGASSWTTCGAGSTARAATSSMSQTPCASMDARAATCASG